MADECIQCRSATVSFSWITAAFTVAEEVCCVSNPGVSMKHSLFSRALQILRQQFDEEPRVGATVRCSSILVGGIRKQEKQEVGDDPSGLMFLKETNCIFLVAKVVPSRLHLFVPLLIILPENINIACLKNVFKIRTVIESQMYINTKPHAVLNKILHKGPKLWALNGPKGAV